MSGGIILFDRIFEGRLFCVSEIWFLDVEV